MTQNLSAEMALVEAGARLYEAFWKRNQREDQRPADPFAETAPAIQAMWVAIAGDAYAISQHPPQEGDWVTVLEQIRSNAAAMVDTPSRAHWYRDRAGEIMDMAATLLRAPPSPDLEGQLAEREAVTITVRRDIAPTPKMIAAAKPWLMQYGLMRATDRETAIAQAFLAMLAEAAP